MSAKVMKPQSPYDVDFTVEYRVLKWIEGRGVWCLVLQTDRLDRALDSYGSGEGLRIERCTWKPAPEVSGTCPLPPAEPVVSLSDVRCDGHYGPGMLRDWAECPLCNPDEPTAPLPPGSGRDA